MTMYPPHSVHVSVSYILSVYDIGLIVMCMRARIRESHERRRKLSSFVLLYFILSRERLGLRRTLLSECISIHSSRARVCVKCTESHDIYCSQLPGQGSCCL